MNCPIYVINMDSSIERWTTIYSRLQEIGLAAERFPATVGKLLSEQELKEWYDNERNAKQHHRPLTKGEIGCYISHYRLWQNIVDNNVPFCIVLEDDVNIEPHLKDIASAIGCLQNWDMIKLYDNRANPFIESYKITTELTLGNYLKVPNGTLAYALSLSGAKKLLARKPFFRAVDIDIQFHSETKLQLLGIQPYPVKEDHGFISEIAALNNGKHSHGSTFWKNLKYRIRMYRERKKKSGILENIIRQ